MTRPIRRGEFHEDEIIDVNGETFVASHFHNCELVGSKASFDDCTFVGLADFLVTNSRFCNCLFEAVD